MRTKKISLWVILLSLPFVAYFVCWLLPTFDDWTYLTRPHGVVLWEDFLPTGSYWRPFDALFGCILDLAAGLFPTLNHICIVAGHAGCAFWVYSICRQLKFDYAACNIATLFFYLCPGMLGAVLGIDSLNQVYSNFWGLAATYIYLQTRKFLVPLLLVLIATFSKENGLAWAVVPPIMAFGMNLVSLKKAAKDIAYGLCVALAYMVVRLCLSSYYADVNAEYFSATIADRIKDVATFIGLSWIGVDYVSAVHAPSRNLAIVAITLIMSLPFILFLWYKNIKELGKKCLWTLLACWIILSLPHLLTLFAAMHGYASLGLAAIIVGFLYSRISNKKVAILLFSVYLLDVLFVDWHHWQKSYESGLVGKDMAEQVIGQTEGTPQNVFLTIVKDDYPKYSSFCVIPSDAFGWGLSVMHYSGYRYPQCVKDTTISIGEKKNIPSLLRQAKQENYDAMWIVEKKRVKVINFLRNE